MGCSLSSPAPATPRRLGDSEVAASADRPPPSTSRHDDSTDAPEASVKAIAADRLPSPPSVLCEDSTNAPAASEEAAAAGYPSPPVPLLGDRADAPGAELQLATDNSPSASQCPAEAAPAPGAPPFLGSAPLRPVMAVLGQRGVSLRWLMRFYEYVVACSGLERDASTKEVVDSVVKRDTQAQRCSYLQLSGVETGVPAYFVSHSWSQPFRYVVECLRQRLAGEEDAVDLKGAVEGMKHTLVVLDPAATVFTRAWCLLEMHTAVVAGRSSDSEKDAGKLQLLPYVLDTADAANLSKLMYGVDIDGSQSYLPEDRQRILEEIERTVGHAAFNSTLKRAFASAVAGMVPRLASPSRQRADLARTAATVLFDGGYDDEAEAMYKEALENLRAVLGSADLHTAACLSRFGDMLWRQDRGEEAESLYQQALAIQRAADPDSVTVAETLQKLASLQEDEEAEATLREALAIWRSAAGRDHPQVAACLVALDEQLPHERRGEKEACCREAVRINQQALGTANPETVYSMCRLAQTLPSQADGEAKELLSQALRHLDDIAPDVHPSGADTLHRLTEFLQDNAMFDESLAAERKSLAIKRKAFGINHPSTADSLAGFALSYGSLEDNDFEEVIHAQRECIRIRREALRPNHPSLANALEFLALFLRGTDNAEGEQLLREAIKITTAELEEMEEEAEGSEEGGSGAEEEEEGEEEEEEEEEEGEEAQEALDSVKLALESPKDFRFEYGRDDAKIRDWLRASPDNALMYVEIRGLLGEYTEVMERELGIRNPGILRINASLIAAGGKVGFGAPHYDGIEGGFRLIVHLGSAAHGFPGVGISRNVGTSNGV
eukprot:jgi/Tetstr1/466068/TSEL_010655.t1